MDLGLVWHGSLRVGPLLPDSYLIGISHFPDPDGIGIRVGFPSASPSLSLLRHCNAGFVGSYLSHTTHLAILATQLMDTISRFFL